MNRQQRLVELQQQQEALEQQFLEAQEYSQQKELDTQMRGVARERRQLQEEERIDTEYWRFMA